MHKTSFSPGKLPRIKVRLDHRTTIIVNRQSSLKIWKKRYPMAEIIH